MTAADTAVAIAPQTNQSLISRMAQRFGVEPNKMLATLKATAFKGEVSNEQMMALLIVAEQYRLNPWVREIYAFPDKNNGIVPVVGVDGWLRILNEHPQYDGCEFADGPVGKEGWPEWIECRIFRKDRTHPTVAREYMVECKRATSPWGSHPRRMLRHKSLIQAGRIAMAFVGIYDQDEAERIVEGETISVGAVDPLPIAELNARISGRKKPELKVEAAPPPPDPEVERITYAYIAGLIAKVDNTDDLDLAVDLISSLADPQQRAELDVEARAKRKALAGK